MNAITVNEMRELTMEEAETVGGGLSFWKIVKVAAAVASAAVAIYNAVK